MVIFLTASLRSPSFGDRVTDKSRVPRLCSGYWGSFKSSVTSSVLSKSTNKHVAKFIFYLKMKIRLAEEPMHIIEAHKHPNTVFALASWVIQSRYCKVIRSFLYYKERTSMTLKWVQLGLKESSNQVKSFFCHSSFFHLVSTDRDNDWRAETNP